MTGKTARRALMIAVLVLGTRTEIGFAQFEEEQVGVPTDIIKLLPPNALGSLTAEKLSDRDKSNLDISAKYMVWRLTWLDNVRDADKLATFVKEFERDYTSRAIKDQRRKDEAVRFFNTKLIEAFRPVFQRKFETNRVSTMHAVQLLPIVAQSKTPEFGEFLLSLVKDPVKHDAVKLYALRGLGEFGAIRAWPNSIEVRKVDVMAPDVSRVQTLIAYIERKWPAGSKEEADASCYLRREAVHALGQVQAPAVVVPKTKKGEEVKMEGPVAITLLRVLAKAELDPTPTLAERCEAALAVCHMKVTDVPDYQPQLGVYAVGVTLSDFINAYRADFANIGKKPTQLYWKTLGDRWRQALDFQAKEASAKAPHAREIQEKTKTMIDAIINHRVVENQSAVDFRLWLNKNKPATKTLFKFSTTEVDLGY